MTIAPLPEMALADRQESAGQCLLVERGPERRIDPVLGAMIDVAIAYRANLGRQVAEAFLREVGAQAEIARRVLDGVARQRTLVPRRWTRSPAPARAQGPQP